MIELCDLLVRFSSDLNPHVSAVTLVGLQKSTLWSAVHFSCGGTGEGGFSSSCKWAAKTLSDECLDLQGSRNFSSPAPEVLGVLSLLLESVTFHQRWSSRYQKPSFFSASITLVWMLQCRVV